MYTAFWFYLIDPTVRTIETSHFKVELTLLVNNHDEI